MIGNNGRTAEIIRDLAKGQVEAQFEPHVVSTAHREKTVFVNGEEKARYTPPLPTQKVHCESLDAFACAIAAHSPNELFIHPDQCLAVEWGDTPERLIDYRPEYTELFAWLIAKPGKATLTHSEFVQFLRTMASGAYMPTTLLANIRAMRVKRQVNVEVEEQHTASKMGRDISMAASGAGDVPETFNLSGSVFRRFDPLECPFDVNVVLTLRLEDDPPRFDLAWEQEVLQDAKDDAMQSMFEFFQTEQSKLKITPAKLHNPYVIT